MIGKPDGMALIFLQNRNMNRRPTCFILDGMTAGKAPAF